MRLDKSLDELTAPSLFYKHNEFGLIGMSSTAQIHYGWWLEEEGVAIGLKRAPTLLFLLEVIVGNWC